MASEKPESGHTNLFSEQRVADWERPLSLLIFLFLSILFTFKIGKGSQKKKSKMQEKRIPEGKRLFFATCKAKIV